MTDAPIGVFDSGAGGLTVARAILDQLPGEDLLYIGDTGHGPYGPLPPEQTREHALAVADTLVDRGAKLVVVACNTASSVMFSEAARRYPVPVVEVIRPAVRRAALTTRTGRVGVLATQGTVVSGAYPAAFDELADADPPGSPAGAPTVTQVACPRFVDFVERGMTAGRQIAALAQLYTEPLRTADVDTVVLGCTHYPLLSGILQVAMGERVTLVSSAEETAKDVLRILTSQGALRDPESAAVGTREFLCTGDPERFRMLATRFLGPGIVPVGRV